MAHVKEADSDRSAADTSDTGTEAIETLGELMLFDKEYLAGQKPGMRVLSHAIHRL